MKKHRKLPIKVIDDFFEIPGLWRYYALKQEFTQDPQYTTWPGSRTKTLDQIDLKLFHSFASKLIKHIPGTTHFASLQVNFASVDSTYGQGWIHTDEPKWNVAGLIYLDPKPAPKSGTLFYDKIGDSDTNFNEAFFNELGADPKDRKKFNKVKEEQRKLFRKTMTVGNVYNRCIIFSPDVWHSADTYFGDTLDNSRLTLTFFGYAV